LVVLGRAGRRVGVNPPSLGDVGDPPPPPQLYQSLVCQEREQAAALLRRLHEERDLIALSDGVVMPTLVRLAQDRARDGSPSDRPAQLALELETLLDALPEKPVEPRETQPAVALASGRRDPVEECGLRWLARVLAAGGMRVRRVGLEALLRGPGEPDELRIVSALGPGSASSAIARLRRRSDATPSANLLLASFGGAADGLLRVSSQIDVAQSCAEIVARIDERERGASTNEADAAEPSNGRREPAGAST
jgi:hypothetical protein